MQNNISTIFKNPGIPEVKPTFTGGSWSASTNAKRIGSGSPVDGKK